MSSAIYIVVCIKCVHSVLPQLNMLKAFIRRNISHFGMVKNELSPLWFTDRRLTSESPAAHAEVILLFTNQHEQDATRQPRTRTHVWNTGHVNKAAALLLAK